MINIVKLSITSILSPRNKYYKSKNPHNADNGYYYHYLYIFRHLSNTNSSMQSKEESISTSNDKLKGFLQKINLRISHVK